MGKEWVKLLFRRGPWLQQDTGALCDTLDGTEELCLCWFSALLSTANQWFLVLLRKRRATEHGNITGKKIPPGPTVSLDQAGKIVSQLLSP